MISKSNQNQNLLIIIKQPIIKIDDYIYLMSQKYIESLDEKNQLKIQKHLSKFVNVESPVWLITSGQFQKVNFRKINNKTKAYRITTLILTNNSHSNIIRDIIGPSYDQLIVLNLSNNGIVSVEPLQKLTVLYLEGLYLDKNLLTNLRSLRKFISTNLKVLDVSMNHLMEIDNIWELNCPNLKQLNLSRNTGSAIFTPFLKTNLNPPQLILNKMFMISPLAKKDFIDKQFRQQKQGQVFRTRF